MKPLNIVFAGTPAFARPCLDALANTHHNLQAIYTQPDRPAGRGRQLHASPVKEWALAHNIPVYQPIHFKESESIEDLNRLSPDVMIVIAYGLILPTSVLSIPRFGCINVHASLLPRWRGASPIQHAILHGDKQSGVTIMQMDKGMDTGDMFTHVTCTINPSDTASDLHDRLSQLAAKPLIETLEGLQSGLINAHKQSDKLVTYAPKINKDDARIDWTQTAHEIEQKIRAFNPWPIAFTHANESVVRIHKATVIDDCSDQPPGTILSLEKKGMLVATGANVLLVERIQFSGGKAMSVCDWLNAGRDQLRKQSLLS